MGNDIPPQDLPLYLLKEREIFVEEEVLGPSKSNKRPRAETHSSTTRTTKVKLETDINALSSTYGVKVKLEDDFDTLFKKAEEEDRDLSESIQFQGSVYSNGEDDDLPSSLRLVKEEMDKKLLDDAGGEEDDSNS